MTESATKPRPFRSPAQFFAFGFGSGLAPRAPGTFGTLAALPIYWLLANLPLLPYTLVLLGAVFFGIWICDRASRELGVHDHPGIVWDEFVGLWVALWALPLDWAWLLAGFALFRLFDILKPWPISWLDRHVSGGLGIMIDDIVAGVMACACLHTLRLGLA
ncbi:MAG: phosphatidylglycerophosphatase A [Pseudomonadota bacterium]